MGTSKKALIEVVRNAENRVNKVGKANWKKNGTDNIIENDIYLITKSYKAHSLEQCLVLNSIKYLPIIADGQLNKGINLYKIDVLEENIFTNRKKIITYKDILQEKSPK